MQPVLALELSTDGILLHELSYDGVWRKISAASLSDPFLPKKMAAMKHAARASQGRFFKNQVWLPPEQIKGLEVKLATQTTEERQIEAEAIVRAHPAFSDGEYIVQFGEEDVNGNVKIAAVNRAILQEADRFVSGYGFGTQGFTSRNRIDGFYQQPYFSVTAPPKVSIDFAKIGFFAGIAVVIAAIIAGGYWAFTNLDFTPDPSVGMEATEERILQLDEDPRAPIRPTRFSTNAEHRIPATISDSRELGPLPEHDISVGLFEAMIEQAPLASTLDIADIPRAAMGYRPVNADLTTPVMLSNSVMENLPAPETSGFPVLASKNIVFEDAGSPSSFNGGQSLARFTAVVPQDLYISSPRLTDVLPRDDSTVTLAAQLRKLNDSLGLTMVRDNNAAMVQMARINELQALPPVVTNGFPRLIPFLRDGRSVATLPPDPVPVIVEEPTKTEDEVQPLVQFTTVISGLTTEQLQRIPPRIFEGRPQLLPILRSGQEISAISVEPVVPKTENTTASDVLEATIAASLRPLTRPQSIELTAIIASISEQAVSTASAPLHRPAGFADKVQAMADSIAEQARVTPTFDDAPRQVNVPTSANVARTATIDNGINLNETSLIGVFGTAGDYRALLRQRGGKYQMLKVGDKIDSWTIVAISENTVRLKKGSKNKTLKLPAEG